MDDLSPQHPQPDAVDLRTAVRAATARLREAGIPSPEVDAVELAAHALGVDAREVRRLMVLGGRAAPPSLATLVDERASRVPLQHLTGRAHFRHLTLAVGPGVFVPRPETETLVELALAEVDRAAGRKGEPVRVVDLCCGSGAIALSLKHERPDAVVRGLEVSPDAWAWATSNRDRLGLDVRLDLGDATQPCFGDWAGTVDVVTVNPPYIPVGAVPLDPEVRDHDPDVALYGGSEDGLAIPLRTAATAAALLRPGGLLLMEHADSQGESLPRRLAAAGPWTGVTDHLDLSGRPRVSTARRLPGGPS
ncbi:peptide chain release factor N(5)-glutamine methyltransferase [Terracoccus luteus]|jgi:release factor glutamine methyltransferase|uniref:Release factor glutamine methyltransferase n=1 Tax=Terracoccus luteus TaxID=53356 RepID=A0A839PTP4_9MICO|nr:peptide chain release factor N(5)-glutamine methyltransferase [Terracoccus luteus]MBB2985395.1 release factor glutamine methyltransferase [Terracoccus luteus]MCP2171047.1 release factor glutamine methyltransferase [Terracoccus luteus]